MPRAKKSDQLLAKLNRSLGGEAESIPQPPPPQKNAKPKRATAKSTTRPRAAAPRIQPADTATGAPSAATPETVPAASPSRRQIAEKHVRQHVMFAAGAGLIPLPLADLAAIGALQLKQLADVAHVYGIEFSKTQAKMIVTSLVGSLGGTVLACSALGSMAKIFPGLGTMLSVTTVPVAAGTITYAIGHIAIDHFEAGGSLQDFDLDVAQDALARRWQDAKTTVQNLL